MREKVSHATMVAMARFIDIHSHLNDTRFDADIEEVLHRMRRSETISIVVGTDKGMSERAVALAETNDDLWATIGLHPTDNDKEEFAVASYEKLAAHPRVVAIGECGLDYYWPEHYAWREGEQKEKERQRQLFIEQIAIARKVKKPLMIHGRPQKGSMDAYQDILSILKAYPDVTGNVHFFVGDIVIAKQFLDIGFTMSFTGVITFANEYDDVVRYLPLDRILNETDAPYVAPKAYRGTRNEPSYVGEITRRIAELKSVDRELVEQTLLQTATKMFGI